MRKAAYKTTFSPPKTIKVPDREIKQTNNKPPSTMERDADYADQPGSPLHPEADAEISERLPSEPIREEELDFLELNPGINVNETNDKEDELDEDFEDSAPGTPAMAPRPLTKHQQSRFMQYVENQHLQIQRKLVQSSLNSSAYSSLSQAIEDISSLMDFIWLSVGDSADPGAEPTLSAQTQLLLAVAVLPLDALLRVPLTQAAAPELLMLLHSLDDKFSRLIDGKTPGGKSASGTERVRMGSIANQTRVLLEEEFTANRILGLDMELATVYENVLERTGVL